MNIYEKLSKIQNELKAPKKQFNKFGNYNYRNAEDILEALKPLCAQYNTSLIVSDKMVIVGDRIYVEATANLYDNENDGVSKVMATAYAREEENKKGMDSSQLTGSTSSYARKYALNGLFNIDDTKDSDFTNTHGNENKVYTSKENLQGARAHLSQIDKIKKMILDKKIDSDKLKAYYKVTKVDDLSYTQAQEIIDKKDKQ